MTRTRIIPLAIAMLIGVLISPAVSQSKQPTKLRNTVERLVKNLASESRAVRVSAEQSLLKLGPRVLPYLPAPELISDVAARETVRQIRVRLDHAQAKQSVKASRVTVQGEYTIKQIIAEVARQTGNHISTDQLPKAVAANKVKADFQATPFWNAMADLSDRGRFRFASNADGDGLVVYREEPQTTIAAADNTTAFRVAVQSIRWKTLFGDDKHRLLNVKWSVTPEPRLRALFLKYGAASMSATAGGKPLAKYSADAKLEIPVTGGAEPIVLAMAFRVPKSAKLSTLSFAGRVSILTAAAQESITFRSLPKAKGAAKRRGGVTVTIRELSLGEKSTSIGIAVAYDTGGPAFESHRTWLFHNRVFLKTSAGKRIAPRPGFKTTLQRDGAIGVRYEFDVDKKTATSATFNYEAPTLLINVPVKFRFKKLRVPKN